jgi:hypothetical protein
MSGVSLQVLQEKKHLYQEQMCAYTANLESLKKQIIAQTLCVNATRDTLHSMCTEKPTTSSDDKKYVLAKLPQTTFVKLMQDQDIVKHLKNATQKNYHNVPFTKEEHSKLLRAILKSPIVVAIPLCLLFESNRPTEIVATQKEMKQHQALLGKTTHTHQRVQEQIANRRYKGANC